MLLIYNPDSDRYEGSEVNVPRWLFDDCVDELVEGGVSERDARIRLLDEAEWANVEVAAEGLGVVNLANGFFESGKNVGLGTEPLRSVGLRRLKIGGLGVGHMHPRAWNARIAV